MATELCVLFTAADAHMRDYSLWTPADCVASTTAAGGEFALRLLRPHLGAEVRPTAEPGLEDWTDSSASSRRCNQDAVKYLTSPNKHEASIRRVVQARG